MVSIDLLNNANIKAFLDTLRYSEGTAGANGYREIFTGILFDDFKDHPRKIIEANGLKSDAAGAYQIMSFTFDEYKKKLNLPDFSPQSQDLCCLQIISDHDALNNIWNGQFATAINKLNKTWASLPGSPYGQPTHTISELLQVFEKNGGRDTSV